MTNNLHTAEALIQKGFSVVPLKKDLKKNHDKLILERDYTLNLIENPLTDSRGNLLWDADGNLGVNLTKSKLIDIDLECSSAIHFGSKLLPRTLEVGREYVETGLKQVTHYFYKNINDDPTLTIDKSFAEFRAEGQTVVYGKTQEKKTNKWVERYFANTMDPIDAPKDLEKKFRIISFLSWLADVRSWSNANEGALKLDSCFKRYCDWSDDERIETLEIFFSYVLEPGHRDVHTKKFERIVKSNNKETKNAGYQSFAKHCDINPHEIKKWIGVIGNNPKDEEYHKTPSRRDFLHNGINMKELMTKDLAPLKFAVPGILPEGLVIWAGRPKAMKSWTALDLVYAIENGLTWLGHKLEQGNTLYLALEDSERRLKDRVYKLGHAFREQHPTTDVEAPYIGFGLEEDLQRWIDGVDSPRLIMIDTLARIKPRTKRSSGTAYDLDNELLRNLQKLAISNGVCICLISHLSKTNTDYNFDRITGSAGLQGMTDAMWLIDRGDTANGKASITGRGRDISDFAYEVKWNDTTWRYDWVGHKEEIDRNENRASIINAMTMLYMEDPKKNIEVKPSQVYKYLDYAPQSKDAKNISRTMQRMLESFEICNGSKFGTYRLNQNIEKSEVPF